MIRRSTVILLVILIALLGLTYYLKHRPAKPPEPTPVAEGGPLFLEAEGQPTSIRIENATGKVVAVQKNSSGQWAITLPKPGETDQGMVEAAVTQISALRSITVLDQSPSSDAIGLKTPAYIISIQFAGGSSHKLEIGDLTPTGSGYYVRQEKTIYVVSQSGIDALLNLLTQPPYAATITPTTAPSTETPTGISTLIPVTETVTPAVTP